MLDYKKLAIRQFKRGKFDDALTLFSLAYEQKHDESLLFLINLCSFAKTSKSDAFMIFDLYLAKQRAGLDDDLSEVLELLQSNDKDETYSVEEYDAISYEDFMGLVKKSEFRSVFENIMFSTRVLISNREDFLEFIQNLIKNDFLDMSMSYLESAAVMFSGDERIARLLNEAKRRKDENLSK